MVFFISVWWATLQEKSEYLFPSIVYKAELWGCEMLSTRSVTVWQNVRFSKQLARQCVCGVFCVEFLAFLTVLVMQSTKKFPALLSMWQLRSFIAAFSYYSVSV